MAIAWMLALVLCATTFAQQSPRVQPALSPTSLASQNACPADSGNAMLTAARRTYAAVLAAGGAGCSDFRVFSPITRFAGCVRVVSSAGNGGYPMVVVIPRVVFSNKDESLEYDVHVHYHGMGSTAARPCASCKLVPRIVASVKSGAPTVFVIPHSATANRASPGSRYGRERLRCALMACAGSVDQCAKHVDDCARCH